MRLAKLAGTLYGRFAAGDDGLSRPVEIDRLNDGAGTDRQRRFSAGLSYPRFLYTPRWL